MSGKKAELVARVFVSYELGISVCITNVQRTWNKEDEKLKLLKMPESLFPDPLLLIRWWFGETKSMQSWPPIFLRDFNILYFRSTRIKVHTCTNAY